MTQDKNSAPALYTNLEITNEENSEVKIAGEIPVEAQAPYRVRAIKKIGENAKIDGFRKGHIPEKVLLEKVGEDAIMHEVAEMAISDLYPMLIVEKGLAVIGRPEVAITKLAPGNPIGFTITTAVMPEVTVPDYKKIAEEVMKEADDLEVTDADVEKVFTEVRRGKARFDKAQKAQEEGATEGTEVTEAKEENEEELPELDDAFVATLGADFKTVADFEKRVREDLAKEKEQKAKEKKRIALSEKIIEKTEVDLPKIMVEGELDKMMAQMRDDVARVNMKLEDYLTHVKKTEEGLRAEWKEQAEKRAKLQLVLNKIATDEDIHADHDEVHKEMDKILEQFKDANPDNVHVFVETQLTNEAVFNFLENGGKKEEKEPENK